MDLQWLIKERETHFLAKIEMPTRSVTKKVEDRQSLRQVKAQHPVVSSKLRKHRTKKSSLTATIPSVQAVYPSLAKLPALQKQNRNNFSINVAAQESNEIETRFIINESRPITDESCSSSNLVQANVPRQIHTTASTSPQGQ